MRPEAVLKGALRMLALACLGALLGVVVYAANARLVGHEEMPMPFGWGMAVVLSGSMEPALAVDDLIVVREDAPYAVGDVVVYQQGGSLVVHRVVRKAAGSVVTQGDANNVADEPVDPAAVKGVVVTRVPGVGLVVRAVQSPAGVLALCVGAVALVEVPYRRRRRQDAADLEDIRREIELLRGKNGGE